MIAKSPEVNNSTKVVSYDDQIQSERNLAKSDMSSPKVSDAESGHSSGVAEEGLIMGAVSDFLDEKRVMSPWQRYSKSLPLPGEGSVYKKGAVLEAVDDFLDTLDECRDDCGDYGGDIASVHSMAENDFITEELVRRRPKRGGERVRENITNGKC